MLLFVNAQALPRTAARQNRVALAAELAAAGIQSIPLGKVRAYQRKVVRDLRRKAGVWAWFWPVARLLTHDLVGVGAVVGCIVGFLLLWAGALAGISNNIFIGSAGFAALAGWGIRSGLAMMVILGIGAVSCIWATDTDEGSGISLASARWVRMPISLRSVRLPPKIAARAGLALTIPGARLEYAYLARDPFFFVSRRRGLRRERCCIGFCDAPGFDPAA